jgi:hypothetical protein
MKLESKFSVGDKVRLRKTVTMDELLQIGMLPARRRWVKENELTINEIVKQSTGVLVYILPPKDAILWVYDWMIYKPRKIKAKP